MNIEIRHLRYLIGATEHGSLRKAARALGIRESAISRGIRELEGRLGTAVLLRHTGGVSLTYAGERFVRHARRAMKEIGDAADDLDATECGERAVIQIGILSSLAAGFIADLFRAYETADPGVRIELVESTPSEHIAAIRRHDLDIALIAGSAAFPDCEVVQLWTEQLFAVLPERHPLEKDAVLSWEQLGDESFIVRKGESGSRMHEHVVQRLARIGKTQKVVEHALSRDNIMQVVALGRGLTITNEAMTMVKVPGIVYRPIAGDTLPFSAVWSPKNDNPVLRRFVILARAMARRHAD